jgi:drug/metabolite transporter (DMT)-like permease
MIENALSYIFVNSIGKILLKLSYIETSFQNFFIFESFFGLLLWGGYGILNGANFDTVLGLLPIALMSALLSEFFIFYIYSKGDLNVVESIFSTYPLFTIFFSHVLLGEVLSERFIPALVLIILGIVLISFKTSIKNILGNKSAAWAIAGAIAVGISDTVSKASISDFSSYEFLFALGVSQIILSFILILFSKRKQMQFKIEFDKKTIAGAFLIALSMIFFWETYNSTLASIASPLTASVVVLIIILSRIILKEKIALKNYVGIFLVILGVILLN